MSDADIRQGVGEVLVRYATGIDRRDWALFRTCFTDDVEADYGDIGRWGDATSLTAWMEASHEPLGHTLHRITNVAISPSPAGATARCYVDAILVAADNQTGMRAVGYYDDELVCTDQGWRIARRRFTQVLLQRDVAVTAL
ncbi:MAG: nuclear transport factor 2 family protein [Acidimicrobiales bacterium]